MAVSIFLSLSSAYELAPKVINKANIGKTVAELIAMWNADNPGDLVS